MKHTTHTPQASIIEKAFEPKLTLRGILYAKFLKWVERSSYATLKRYTARAIGATIVFCSIVVPWHVLGVISTMTQNRVFLGVCVVALLFYSKMLIKLLPKARAQKTEQRFHGVAISDLTDFLIANGGFPVQESIRALSISQPQQKKIAKALEEHGILQRGSNNSRVLRPITPAELTLQLSEDFPLTWNEAEGIWEECGKHVETCVQVQDAHEQMLMNRRKHTNVDPSPPLFTVRELSMVGA